MWGRLGLAVAIIGLAAIAATIVLQASRALPTLQQMGIPLPEKRLAPVAAGELWTPAAGDLDAEGFAEVADNGKFTLLLAPESGQIAVRSRDSGYVWRSNPPASTLERETVKGLQRTNLESPYIIEYVSEGKTQRNMENVRGLDLVKEYRLLEQEHSIQATYTYPKLEGLSLAIQYRLTDAGLEAAIPASGIKEEGKHKLYAIHLLPFFGAVSGVEEEGYLFVPDGPGGLLYYREAGKQQGNRYEFPLYGTDVTLGREQGAAREQISYPVFGLKRGDEAFAAIVKEGGMTALVRAQPGGSVSTYHTVNAIFIYREEYLRKLSRLAPPVVSMQKELNRRDRRVEYRLLAGGEAGYVGMAHAYRSYLEESGQLQQSLAPVTDIPLQLALIGGGSKPRFGGLGYSAATTFAQAEEIAAEVAGSGIASLRVIYHGWQDGGFTASDGRFPIEPALGGAKGAARLAEALHEQGGELWFADNLVWMDADRTRVSPKTDGIRSIDSTVLFDKITGLFILNPAIAVRGAHELVERLQQVGADGIQYTGLGEHLFRDYNPGQPLEREDTAHLYRALLEYTAERLGGAGVDRGNDYVLSGVSLINELPMESSYDLLIDETVPFYPIALHGAVGYTAGPGNLRNEYGKELLRAIEYGALPYFQLTYEPSLVLKGTDYSDVYSSEYGIWKSRLLEEYSQFNQLAAVYHQRIADHRKLAEGVYLTRYEDGTEVTVNYNTLSFEVTHGERGRQDEGTS